MEVAIIDWKRIDSRYVKDEALESINAPQWVDFNAPDDVVDDQAWFCRPECNHPKTVDDFKESSPSPKRLFCLSEMHPLGEPSLREANLKKRGIVQPSVLKNKGSRWDKIGEDSENQNPNFATPPCASKTNKFLKQGIKSSADKTNAAVEINLQKEKTPSLRRTMSAKNLFGGGEIITKISEFCNELKRLALKAKERETEEEKHDEFSNGDKGRLDDGMTDVDIKEERTPLLDMSKGNKATMLKNKLQQKQRGILRYDDAENSPISIDVKNTRNKYENSIRTNPPTPQCFSSGRGQPPKAFKCKPPLERGVLEELRLRNKDEEHEGADAIKSNHHHHINKKQTSIIGEKEAKTLDVFWFLKPCTLSS